MADSLAASAVEGIIQLETEENAAALRDKFQASTRALANKLGADESAPAKLITVESSHGHLWPIFLMLGTSHILSWTSRGVVYTHGAKMRVDPHSSKRSSVRLLFPLPFTVAPSATMLPPLCCLFHCPKALCICRPCPVRLRSIAGHHCEDLCRLCFDFGVCVRHGVKGRS